MPEKKNKIGLVNESVPKIIINNTINLFLAAISILVISNHNSFRVLFVTKSLPCILFEKYI